MQVENQLKNQIADAKTLLSTIKEKVEARIFYENCPLCKSNKITKSASAITLLLEENTLDS